MDGAAGRRRRWRRDEGKFTVDGSGGGAREGDGEGLVGDFFDDAAATVDRYRIKNASYCVLVTVTKYVTGIASLLINSPPRRKIC